MTMKLFSTLPILATALIAVAACSDSTDPNAIDNDDTNGGGGDNGNGEQPANVDSGTSAKPVFAVSSVFFGPEGNTTYLSLLDSLSPQTIDYTKAIELSGWADVWVHNGAIFVSDGESPTITKYTLSEDGKPVKGATLSFAGRGVTDAAFWANTFVASNKAYMLNGTSGYEIWNPETMELGGSIALPTLDAVDGMTVRNGTTDRSNVIRDGKLYQPLYWSDDDYVRFTPNSKLAVFDIATDKLVDTIDVPCAGLDIGSIDEKGDMWFSTWTSGVVQPLMKETPSNCVAKVAAGTNTATAAFKFADVAEGREGAAVRYDGFGRILFPVFYNERATYSDASGLIDALGEPNWRMWSYDRTAGTASVVDSVDWNSGAVYVLPVGGKTHLLIPGDGYATTKVLSLEGSTATPLFETRGWAIRLFQVR